MKVKTNEASGVVLDWMVAKCEGVGVDTPDFDLRYMDAWPYSTEWSQGGPIIERWIYKLFKNVGGTYTAQIKTRAPYYSPTYDADIGMDVVTTASGPSPLIAAMRCYVTSKLGDSVEVPNELLEN